MIRVLLVANSDSYSGIRTFLRSLTSYFSNNKTINLELVFIYNSPPSATSYKKQWERDLKRSLFNRFFLNLRSFWKLKTFIEKFQPDLLIGADIDSKRLVLILKLIFFRKIPLIVLFHGIYNFRNKFLFFFVRQFYKQADIFISVSRKIREDVVSLFKINPSKCIAIHNGLDVQTIQVLSKIKPRDLSRNIESYLKKKSKKIFINARLHEQKDYLTLFKALKIVRKSLINTELFVIGAGPLYNFYQQKIKELNLTSNIHFIGVTENPFYYLKYADIYVHSTFYEGFGFAILEAMALKKPIIATGYKYGPREILGYNKYGILLPVGDEKLLAQKIIYLLQNEKASRRFAQLAVERARYFSLEQMGEQYEKLIKKLYYIHAKNSEKYLSQEALCH